MKCLLPFREFAFHNWPLQHALKHFGHFTPARRNPRSNLRFKPRHKESRTAESCWSLVVTKRVKPISVSSLDMIHLCVSPDNNESDTYCTFLLNLTTQRNVCLWNLFMFPWQARRSPTHVLCLICQMWSWMNRCYIASSLRVQVGVVC